MKHAPPHPHPPTRPPCAPLQAKCEWGTTDIQRRSLTSAVFAGMVTGAPFWGWFSDTYGRKRALQFSTAIATIFGFATAAAPSFSVRARARAGGTHCRAAPCLPPRRATRAGGNVVRNPHTTAAARARR